MLVTGYDTHCSLACCLIPTVMPSWWRGTRAIAIVCEREPSVRPYTICKSRRQRGETRPTLTLPRFVQSGNIVASNIYREDDRPYYIRGNKILLALCCYNICLFVFVKFYYIVRNKKREEAWAKLTGEEKVDYVHETKDEGAKRLDFRFVH